MPVLTLHQIDKAFGSQVLLENVTLSIGKQARIGLIGRNGEGKSTLLRIMAGQMESDAGEVSLRRNAKVAYLPQAPNLETDRTVFSIVAEGLGEVSAALNAYEQALIDLSVSQADDNKRLMKNLECLQLELERSGAWQFRSRIESAISRLGLQPHDQVGKLSGGWQRRVSLARAVVAEPDLLLLDEPTNHLDVESIEWLEDFVAGFSGAVAFVTHDRYFLDAVAEEVIELDRGQVRYFDCNYAEYLDKKAEMLAVEVKQQRKFDQMLAQEERWIRQGIPARRTRNEGRVRNLESLRHERDQRRMRGGDVELRVACGVKSGKMLMEAVDVSHAFGDKADKKVIVKDFCCKIMAGERIGLVGPNGVGKTTLLNILLGELTPDGGRMRHGVRLATAFLKQMRHLDGALKIKDVLLPQGGNYVYVGGSEPRHIVGYLEDFLFDRERLRAPVSALSGGERGRLMLAKLLLEPANLLVLDEPTNDLDIATLSVLEKALAKYSGTVLMVSHDRAFMDRVVSRVLAFEADGKIMSIDGGYTDYSVWKLRQAEKAKALTTKAVSKKPVKSKQSVRKVTKLSYKEQQQLQSLPDQIESMEAEKSEIEIRFCEPDYFVSDEATYIVDQQRLRVLESELKNAYECWEALEEKQAELAG